MSFLFYHKLLATCFDEEFARLRGIHTGFYSLLLLVMTALTIVLLAQIVGIVMVIALLTLPAATASFFSKRLWPMMSLAVFFSLFFTLGGLLVSYKPDYPSGPTIILFAAAFYFLVFFLRFLSAQFFPSRIKK